MSERKHLNLVQISELTGADEATLRIYVEEEWICPAGDDSFDEEDLARVRLIQELRRDFGVNDESVPIILHLLDQLYSLRAHMRKLAPRG